MATTEQNVSDLRQQLREQEAKLSKERTTLNQAHADFLKERGFSVEVLPPGEYHESGSPYTGEDRDVEYVNWRVQINGPFALRSEFRTFEIACPYESDVKETLSKVVDTVRERIDKYFLSDNDKEKGMAFDFDKMELSYQLNGKAFKINGDLAELEGIRGTLWNAIHYANAFKAMGHTLEVSDDLKAFKITGPWVEKSGEVPQDPHRRDFRGVLSDIYEEKIRPNGKRLIKEKSVLPPIIGEYRKILQSIGCDVEVCKKSTDVAFYDGRFQGRYWIHFLENGEYKSGCSEHVFESDLKDYFIGKLQMVREERQAKLEGAEKELDRARADLASIDEVCAQVEEETTGCGSGNHGKKPGTYVARMVFVDEDTIKP